MALTDSKNRNTPSPATLRSRFGANLRQLSQGSVSISELCRQLGINRTQFNRYLSGESFPRPDVLYRICDYFEVDARILLEPVDEIAETSAGLFQHPDIVAYLGGNLRTIPEQDMPSGMYRFARRSFSNNSQFVQGLNYVFRRDGYTFLRGFEAKDAMRAQGLPTTPAHREFRAAVLPQEDGVAILAGRRGATTGSFNYLARLPSFENNFWVGYGRAYRPRRYGRAAVQSGWFSNSWAKTPAKSCPPQDLQVFVAKRICRFSCGTF